MYDQNKISYGRRSGQNKPMVSNQAGGGGESSPTLGLADTVIDNVRKAIVRRAGSDSIASISRRFMLMDRKGSGRSDGRLTPEELYWSLKDIGIHITKQDANIVLASIDTNQSGDVCFDEFLYAMRGKMSQRRKDVVDQAFDVLDRGNDGAVSAADMMQMYDTRNHPDVVSGKKTPEQVIRTFMSMFDDADGDGVISRKEFREYYRNVSASVDTDDQFIQIITNAWNLNGKMVGAGPLKKNIVGEAMEFKVGEGNGQMPQGRSLPFKVMCQFKDGSVSEVEVKDTAGLNRNQIDVRAVKQRLVRQGVHEIARITPYLG